MAKLQYPILFGMVAICSMLPRKIKICSLGMHHCCIWVPCTYFVWVLMPPLLGVFWYQWLQLAAKRNGLSVQVDAKKGCKLMISEEITNRQSRW